MTGACGKDSAVFGSTSWPATGSSSWSRPLKSTVPLADQDTIASSSAFRNYGADPSVGGSQASPFASLAPSAPDTAVHESLADDELVYWTDDELEYWADDELEYSSDDELDCSSDGEQEPPVNDKTESLSRPATVPSPWSKPGTDIDWLEEISPRNAAHQAARDSSRSSSPPDAIARMNDSFRSAMLGNRFSKFSSLPAELRNEIYLLTLPEPGNHSFISDPLPALARACKLTRAESLPMYLGTRQFYCTVASNKTDLLVRWLRIFQGFDDNAKRAFVKLQISYEGRLLDLSTFRSCSVEEHRLCRWSSNMDLWNGVISAMRDAGLKASQIGLQPALETQVREALGSRQQDDWLQTLYRTGGESYLFSRFVLSPLLHLHGLYDADMHLDSLQYLLQEERMHTMQERQQLEEMVTFALRMCQISAPLWFERWAACSAAVSDPVAAASNERARAARMRDEACRLKVTDSLEPVMLARHERLAVATIKVRNVPWTCVKCKFRDLRESIANSTDRLLDKDKGPEAQLAEVDEPCPQPSIADALNGHTLHKASLLRASRLERNVHDSEHRFRTNIPLAVLRAADRAFAHAAELATDDARFNLRPATQGWPY